MTKSRKKQFIIDGINVECEKKHVKHLYCSVRPHDGHVRISAPLAMSDKEIVNYVQEKIPWIRDKLGKKVKQPNLKTYENGENHFFAGKPHALVMKSTTGRSSAVQKAPSTIVINVQKGKSIEDKKHLLTELYRRELKKILPDIIAKWEHRTGIFIRSWNVRVMKTRWGSANVRDRRIWLNVELMKKELKCIEYIVLHEMLHMVERGHGKRFYELMDQWMPDWKQRSQKLENPEYV